LKLTFINDLHFEFNYTNKVNKKRSSQSELLDLTERFNGLSDVSQQILRNVSSLIFSNIKNASDSYNLFLNDSSLESDLIETALS
jgi:hypothetical protein